MRRWKNRPEGSNWGEFGEDDQKGRINLITPDIRLKAAAQIKHGLSFCLSLPLDYPGGNALIKARQQPRLFTVRREGGQVNYNFPWRALTCQHDHLDVTCDDAVTLFTQYSTQWDALSHYGQFFDADGDGEAEKVYYNGFRAEEHIISPAEGSDEPRAKALGIQNLAETCAQGRGTMVNLHAVYGRDRVAVGYDDLMRIMDQQNVTVEKGDFLCFYTGFDDVLLGMHKEPDPKLLHAVCCGLDGGDEKLQQWISNSGVVALIADNTAVELLPSARRGRGPRPLLPLHAHCLFKQGIHLGELWYLKDLADWLMATKRSHFFLTAPPLRLPGSVGSPLTPVATV
ncbi:cyclase [Afipia sp. P52-10]|nr:cyclase family protein [Afipia sp. P52-10]ETR76934.1 cyclase [Afipia sp. P52-10]